MTDGTNAPAAWYPDPTGQPGQRYWDGAAWTEQTRASDAVETPPPEEGPTTTTTPPEYTSPGGGSTSAGAASTTSAMGTNVDVSAFFRNTPRGLLIVFIAALVFLIATFLPWITAEAPGFGSESENAWSGDVPFALLGPSAEELALGDSGTTDMLLLFPLIAVAAGLAIALARGAAKPGFAQAIVALGVAAALLMLLEFATISAEAGDFEDLAEAGGFDASVSTGFGLWIAVLAAIGVAVGGFVYLREPKVAPAA